MFTFFHFVAKIMNQHLSKFSLLLFLAFIILVSIPFISSNEPGFKAILTEKCMEFLSEQTKTYFVQYLHKLKNITKKFKIFGFDVEISRIKVTTIEDRFDSNLLFQPEVGFEHKIKNLSMRIGAKYETQILSISATGFVSIKIYKLSISSMIRTKNANGKMNMDLQSCITTIGYLDLEFVDGSVPINLMNQLMTEDLKRNLKTVLQEQLCEYARNEFIPLLAKTLMNVPTTAHLFDNYFYDYSLSEDPKISSDRIETDHNGSTFVMKTVDLRDDVIPFLSPKISFSSYNLSSNIKMAYVFMSDFSLRTLLYFLWKDKLLDYVISKDKVDSSKAQYLRTDCDEMEICASTLFPSLKILYPSSYAEITIKPTSAPQVILQSGQVTVISNGSIECYIRKHEIKSNLFSTDVDIYMSIKSIQLKNYSLNFQIKIDDYKLMNFKSSLDELDEGSLKPLVSFAKATFLEPDLNKLLKNGIVLPKLLNFDIVNSSVEIVPDMIVASTDFCVKCDDISIKNKTIDTEEEYYHTG